MPTAEDPVIDVRPTARAGVGTVHRLDGRTLLEAVDALAGTEPAIGVSVGRFGSRRCGLASRPSRRSCI